MYNKISLLLFSLLFSTILSAQVNPKWLRYSTISPDGEDIAFTYKGDLFRVPVEGGTAVQLTFHQSHDYMPVWSKDGKKLAFASDRYGNFDVYLMDAMGGPAKRLTYHSNDESPYTFTAEDSDVMKILKDGVLEKDMYNKKYKDQHKDNGTEMEIMQTMNALNTLNEMNGMNGMNEKYENYEKYDEDKNGKEDKKVKDTYNTDKIRFEVKMGSKQGHKYAKDIKGDSSIYVNGKNGPLVHLFKGNEYVFECSMNGKKLILSEVPMGKMIREVDGVKRQGDSVMIKVTDKTPRYFYYRTPENDLLGGLIIVHDRD